MSKFQDITTWLMAAGCTVSDNGKSPSYLHEENGDLCMKTRLTQDAWNQYWITTGVRSGTSAPVVSLDFDGRLLRMVFVVKDNNVLRCYAKPTQKENEGAADKDEDETEDDDSDDDLWPEIHLGHGNVMVHRNSQLAASFGHGSIHVCYQRQDGFLGMIVREERGWAVQKLPCSDAAVGSPITIFGGVDDRLCVLYLSRDRTLHLLTKIGSHGDWKDACFSSVTLEGSVSRITVATDEGDTPQTSHLAFFLIGNSLAMLRQDGDLMETLGIVNDGEFVAANGQERVPIGWLWCPIPTIMRLAGQFLIRLSIELEF